MIAEVYKIEISGTGHFLQNVVNRYYVYRNVRGNGMPAWGCPTNKGGPGI